MLYHKNCWIYLLNTAYLYSKPISQFNEKGTIVWMASLRYEAKAIQESFCSLFVCLSKWTIMKIAIYILHTFSWRIIWMRNGPVLSRFEISLIVFTCIKFVDSNTFHFIFKKRNIRHSHLIWDAYAYMIIAIWLYVHLVNRWLVVGHVGKRMSIASTEKVLYPKPNKNMKTTNGSVARNSVAWKQWILREGEKLNPQKRAASWVKCDKGDDR